MVFIQIKSMAGMNFIRASDVIAVQFSDPLRCSIMMAGGISLACTEPASAVAERVEAALAGQPAGSPASPAKEEV